MTNGIFFFSVITDSWILNIFELFYHFTVIIYNNAQIFPSLSGGSLFKLVTSPFDTTLVVFDSFHIV